MLALTDTRCFGTHSFLLSHASIYQLDRNPDHFLSALRDRSYTVPLGVAALALQSSLYDVPGGYRAVMFDRFAGVKNAVSIQGFI
jgi:hypothetical protein